MPTDNDVRIKIGVSVDANASAVMAPLENAVKRARRSVDTDMKAAGKSIAGETKKGTTSAEQSWKKLEKEVEQMAREMLRAEKHAADKGVSITDLAERRKTELVLREAKKRAAAEKAAQREIDRVQNGRFFGGNGGSGGGAIGIGRRAGIRVSRAAALGYGVGGAAISGMMSIAREAGYETSPSEMMGKAMSDQALATKISNAGNVPGSKLVDPRKIFEEAAGVGANTGTDTSELLQGLQAFVGKTGDLETGRKTLADMAILARATGSNFEDMSNAAAEVTNNLGDMPDKAKVTSQIMKMIAGQGKLGAVEIRDMASQMAKLAAAGSRFEGGAAKNIPLMGVLAQEAKLRGGAASAGQAATSVMAFSADFAQKANLKNWQARHLSPFADAAHTQLSDPKSLIEAALRSASGPNGAGKASLDVMKTLFPSKQGFKAVQGFASIYNEGGGGSKGMAAVEEEFRRLAAAGLDDTEMMRAFTASMQNADAKSKSFNAKLELATSKLTTELVPALDALTPAVLDVANAFASGASGLHDLLTHGADQRDKSLSTEITAGNWAANASGFVREHAAAAGKYANIGAALSTPGGGSDILASLNLGGAAPMLNAGTQEEKQVQEQIAKVRADLLDKTSNLKLTDKDLTPEKLAYLKGSYKSQAEDDSWSNIGQGHAQGVVQDVNQLQQLMASLDATRSKHDELIAKLSSGELGVIVKNIKDLQPGGPSGSPTPGAPPGSDVPKD